jgi:glyoxylase-like metal-dependent hydrolase (beta-lactamase superfamily II)
VAVTITRAGTHFVNWYVVEEDGKVTIVDAGLPSYRDQIESTLAGLGRTIDDVEAVVFTHVHPDHVGFARSLKAAVWAPAGPEQKRESLPAVLARLGRFVAQLRHREARRLAWHFVRSGGVRSKPPEDLCTFGDGEIDVPGRPVAISTPGHMTPHAALFFAEAGAICVGDAFCGRHPLTGEAGPRRFPAVMNRDDEQALESLKQIEGLAAQHVYFGHGDEWDQGIGAAVERARELGPS